MPEALLEKPLISSVPLAALEVKLPYTDARSVSAPPGAAPVIIVFSVVPPVVLVASVATFAFDDLTSADMDVFVGAAANW
jgi:hypothetical protein